MDKLIDKALDMVGKSFDELQQINQPLADKIDNALDATINIIGGTVLFCTSISFHAIFKTLTYFSKKDKNYEKRI